MFDRPPRSLSAVVVPHEEAQQTNSRCEASCTPGSLGAVRRSGGASLCQPSQSQCHQELPVTELSSRRCEAWARIFPFLHSPGRGRQILQDPAKGSWLACSVFCQTVSGTWYSPRTELQQYHLSAALPEGTLCHSSEEESYYCQVSHLHPTHGSISDNCHPIGNYKLGWRKISCQNIHPWTDRVLCCCVTTGHIVFTST